jgi:pyruvate dehydrogenase E1 component alpha subunit
MQGHSTSDDPRVYRPDAQVDPWRKLDPILRLKQHLVHLSALGESEDAALHKEVDEEIRQACAKAEEFGPPAPASMFDDVYASLPWHLAEQRDALALSKKEESE